MSGLPQTQRFALIKQATKGANGTADSLSPKAALQTRRWQVAARHSYL